MAQTDETRSAPDAELLRAVWEEARELIKRLEGSSVQRLAVEAGEYKIEIERGLATPRPGDAAAAYVAADAIALSGGDGVTADAARADGHPIMAPLVGTFYRAPQPGAKPFVEEGDVVDIGQTVGIVEAMKLMNQVATDAAGKVAAIIVNDGEWVEFEQVLMYIEPLGE